MRGQLLVGHSQGHPVWLDLKLANRHGLITGATGTGKTVTLQTLAEGFSGAGVPVFATDVKSDLSGVANGPFPVKFWDLFGEQGLPIKTTFEEVGPLLLGRLLNLTPTQSGVLDVVFLVAHDKGIPLRTVGEFRQALAWVAENAKWIGAHYGYVAPSTVAIIQRAVVGLDQQGASCFFGEPTFNPVEFIRMAGEKGVINLLCADRLMSNPQVYVAFLVWMLMKLFDVLPEVGDLDKPKLVFFFDEAHLLFSDAPKALLDAVERVVRLIRSKGVGVYFVTQNPIDVPDKVLAQLSNRVQHALRAFTPKDMRSVKAAAETFRQNPAIDTVEAITELGVGEALVSMLEATGRPGMVQRVQIEHPEAQIGALTAAEKAEFVRRQRPKGFQQQVKIELEVREKPKRKSKMLRVLELAVAAYFVLWLTEGIIRNWPGVGPGFGG